VGVINAGDHFFPWLVAAFRETPSAHPPAARRRQPRGAPRRLAAHALDLAVMSHPPGDRSFAAEPSPRTRT
jgi:hypothetical protein